MLNRKTWFLFLFIIFLLTFPCFAQAFSGKVIGVAGGDTVIVLRKKEGFMGYLQTPVNIRLYGIDTPERGQAFGKKAKQFTSEMVYKKTVQVTEVTTDRYGRTVALVAVDKQLLNEELVKAGLAWVYTRYCDWPICETWKALQLKAMKDKHGLWSEPYPMPPWEFRRKLESEGSKDGTEGLL